MKKIVVNTIMILIIFALLCSVILNFNRKKDSQDNKLQTVRVADATLTSKFLN